MIREVLQLGIKGQDVVEGTLKRIQKEKEKFAQKAIAEFTPKKAAELSRLKEEREARSPQRELNYLKAAREAESEKNVRSAVEAPMRAAQGLSSLQGTSAITATMEGVGMAVGGPLGVAAAKAAGFLVDAGMAFSENVKGATVTVADTMDAWNRAQNITGSGTFLRSSRVDIDVNSQRAIIEGLGQKYGIVQDDLKQSITRIFGTTETPGGATDVAQASAIAMGNFSALGNDKGFFMQKIADSFAGLPPSIRQKMTSQMMDMIPEDALMKQRDVLERSNVVAYDKLRRDRELAMLGPKDQTGQYSNIETAKTIQNMVNTMDTSLNRGMGILANKMDKLINVLLSRTETGKARN